MDDSLEAFLRDSTPVEKQSSSAAASSTRTRIENTPGQLRKTA